MRITYDAEARAVYVYLSDDLPNARVATRPIDEHVLVDVDADHGVVGIEILNVDEPPSVELLMKTETWE